jgi:hypothetical protein
MDTDIITDVSTNLEVVSILQVFMTKVKRKFNKQSEQKS